MCSLGISLVVFVLYRLRALSPAFFTPKKSTRRSLAPCVSGLSAPTGSFSIPFAGFRGFY